MVGVLVLRVAAVVGFLTAVAAGSVYLYRFVPRAYPQERTRLDARTYRTVRAALAIGIVVGGLGAALSLVDTVGTIQAIHSAEAGLLAGLAILVPTWLGIAMVRIGVGLLVGAALLAGYVEFGNARR